MMSIAPPWQHMEEGLNFCTTFSTLLLLQQLFNFG